MARRPKVALFTLGCAKNLVNSERIASLLEAGGAEVVHDVHGAGVAIVNTCGFIEAAKEESVDAVLDLADKEGLTGPRVLIMAGCLSQRYGEELCAELPEVDAFVGIEPEDAARLALEAVGLTPHACASQRARRLTPSAWSYLQISEGCDNRCAYCAIPLIRGPLRSRPEGELLDEARYLAGSGVRELNVIAQDTTAYGTDTVGEPRLHTLLRDLCAIDGLEWVRLLYAHPAHFYDGLVDVLASEEKLCPYVDLPLQHVSDRLLKAMGRKVTRAQIEALVGTLREAIPDVTLRTTFITGLPGETEEEFEELLEFVQEQRFDRVGCFAYSPEEDTPAAGMPRPGAGGGGRGALRPADVRAGRDRHGPGGRARRRSGERAHRPGRYRRGERLCLPQPPRGAGRGPADLRHQQPSAECRRLRRGGDRGGRGL